MKKISRLVVGGVRLENFIENLLEWEAVAAERNDFPNWRRSPGERENRRESIVYGNCLEVVKAYLGRRRVNELMRLARKAKAKAREAPSVAAAGGAALKLPAARARKGGGRAAKGARRVKKA